MRTRGFAHVDTWIFDLDNTLYSHEAQIWPQVGQRITEFVARMFSLDPVEARRLQKQYYYSHGTTLRGLMDEHGLDPAEYLDFVHDVDLSLLSPNERLAKAISALPGRKLIFTNGSARHAENICRKLGVYEHFHGCFDILAANFVPKPEQGAYEMLVERHEVDPARAVFFEDMARNLAPAHALGMTTTLVLPATPDPYREPFEQAREELAHVDHVTDDLVGFLEEVAAAA
ncbi:pyrimidine 5'-nucleotidase [Camelimonas abortus]|uniref:Pyrimidine 5'-nucleotidase n=1 Tax=Camelimonas abortus TaxID=1017184 RepID=A0ABV7LC58_9HYPH